MKKLVEFIPLVVRVVGAIAEGISKGETDEEIRRRVADPSVILADDLAKLRQSKDDLDDFVRNG